MDDKYKSRSLYNDPQRHLKERFAGMYHTYKDLPDGEFRLSEYHQRQINFLYTVDRELDYIITKGENTLVFENEVVKVEYVFTELGDRFLTEIKK